MPLAYRRVLGGGTERDERRFLDSIAQPRGGGETTAIPIGRAHAGIYLLAKHAVRGKRRRVLMSRFTIPDIVTMVVLAGAEPVYYDFEPSSTACDLDGGLIRLVPSLIAVRLARRTGANVRIAIATASWAITAALSGARRKRAALGKGAQDLECGGIRPMEVLEHEDQRLIFGARDGPVRQYCQLPTTQFIGSHRPGTCRADRGRDQAIHHLLRSGARSAASASERMVWFVRSASPTAERAMLRLRLACCPIS